MTTIIKIKKFKMKMTFTYILQVYRVPLMYCLRTIFPEVVNLSNKCGTWRFRMILVSVLNPFRHNFDTIDVPKPARQIEEIRVIREDISPLLVRRWRPPPTLLASLSTTRITSFVLNQEVSVTFRIVERGTLQFYTENINEEFILLW